MNNTINSFPPFYTPYDQAGGHRTESFQHSAEKQKESDISITTAEGDIVTISSSFAMAMAYSSTEEFSPGMRSQSYTLMSMESSSFNMSIQGDLSEEELQDIKHLLHDLKKIAQAFFKGDTQMAMNRALDIGDMGSVTELSASFGYSEYISTTQSIATYQPLPAEGIPAGTEDLQEIIADDSAEKFNFADILKARWQQILESFNLDEEKDAVVDAIKQAYEENDIPAAEHMVERVLETIKESPQLTPFVVSVANKAINDAAESVSKMKGQQINPEKLQNDFLKQWKDWTKT